VPAVLVLAACFTVATALLWWPKREGEVTMHVAGHDIDDDDVHTLFSHMRAGEDNITLQVIDGTYGVKRAFQMQVGRFDPNFTANSSGTTKSILLINEETGGLPFGNVSIQALVCDTDGKLEANCTIETSRPRSLLDDNEADVIKHAITYGVVGTVVIVCIAACTPAVLQAAPAIMGAAGCFPSRATVQAISGARAIKSLSIGTMLLTSQGYSPFFLSGHNDLQAITTMVQFTMASNHTLTVTPDHYLPLSDGVHRSAGRIATGDELLVQVGSDLVPSAITSVDSVEEQGLFNPYTIAGDLVVDGVLASCHSSWFLEGVVPEAYIVPAYEATLAPLGSLYGIAPGWFARFAADFAKDPRPLSEVGWLHIAKTASVALFRR